MSIAIVIFKYFIVGIIIDKHIPSSSYLYKIAMMLVFYTLDYCTSSIIELYERKVLNNTDSNLKQAIDDTRMDIYNYFNIIDKRLDIMDERFDVIMDMLNEHYGYRTVTISIDNELEFNYRYNNNGNYIRKRKPFIFKD